MNLLENFRREEPLYGVHFEKLGDKLHSTLAGNLADQVDTVPLVPAVPTQGLNTVQKSPGSTRTRVLSL